MKQALHESNASFKSYILKGTIHTENRVTLSHCYVGRKSIPDLQK